MDTILTSFLTSLIVSLVTFVLGLKAGKNQSDRKDSHRKRQLLRTPPRIPQIAEKVNTQVVKSMR